MHAIRLHEFGPAENLRYEEVDDPKPGANQVRVAVSAAGVHFVDTSIRSGATGAMAFPLPELPTIPGREVAGVVDAVGSDVDDGWHGRRVVAHLGVDGAGYAELAVVDAGSLHALPDHVADDAAVAMIGTGRTAMAILDVAELGPNDVVLLTAAAGGLGSLLIQAVANAGGFSIGAAGGPAKVEQVGRLGAHIAVDYLEPDWPATVRSALGDREITVALEGVGGRLGRQALELVGIGGRLILFGFSSGEPLELGVGDLFSRGLTVSAAIGARITKHPRGIRAFEDASLAELAAGRLLPLIGQRYPLADAAAAHRAIETRATMGKTVLIP